MITRASQVVVGVLALFGSVFLEISPPLPSSTGCPEGGEQVNAAVASFIALAVFLFVVGSAQANRNRIGKRVWIRRSRNLLLLAIPLAITYFVFYGWVVVEPVSGNVVLTGLWTSAGNLDISAENRPDDRLEMLRLVGCPLFARAWSYVSVASSYVILMILYTSTLLCVVGSFFCISEGVFGYFTSKSG